MKIISINVNGIRQAAAKGFIDWMVKQDADVVCVQDLQAKSYELDDSIYYPPGYDGYFFDAEQDNYSGVAVYCKKLPKAIMTGMAIERADREGRFIQADYDKISIASFLMPQATDASSQEEKFAFMEQVMEFMKKLRRKRREFIICGTWHIAHKSIDLANWSDYQNTPGFLPEERAFMDQIFGPLGFIDAFREVNREADQYTWWPSEEEPRDRQDGWRLDYQVVGPNLRRSVQKAWIDKSVTFSKHAPLIIEYDLEI